MFNSIGKILPTSLDGVKVVKMLGRIEDFDTKKIRISIPKKLVNQIAKMMMIFLMKQKILNLSLNLILQNQMIYLLKTHYQKIALPN